MISFNKFTLDNGLKVIHHLDESTPMVAINIIYHVGSKNETPDKTGFAHLFEHLMFGGSVNIPDYDEPLQKAGGENNAWTSSDITNYYLTVPAQNVETGFWLESDRMLSLAFSEESLDVQRKVVVEEFRQRYLNQPYGDAQLLLMPLAYKKHPYSWPTIGKEISHIEETTIEQVKAFFESHYAPNNAILSIAGNISLDKTKELTKKWFGPIPFRKLDNHPIPSEPEQTEARFESVERNVPQDSIYMAFPMCERTHPNFHTIDLISDILSNGQSCRFHQRLIKEGRFFNAVQAYVSDNEHPGLFNITGKPAPGVSLQQAREEIWKELRILCDELVTDYELTKVKNKVESSLVFTNMHYLNKAISLAQFELQGDANYINLEVEKYLAVTPEKIKALCNKLFAPEKENTLYYNAAKTTENE